LWVGIHDDAGQSPVDARLPGTLVANDLPVFVLRGVLSEIPDVAVAVLRVPVVSELDGFTVHADDIFHHGGRDGMTFLVRDVTVIVSFSTSSSVWPRRRKTVPGFSEKYGLSSPSMIVLP
jgi:hypothetical protein